MLIFDLELYPPWVVRESAKALDCEEILYSVENRYRDHTRLSQEEYKKQFLEGVEKFVEGVLRFALIATVVRDSNLFYVENSSLHWNWKGPR